MAVAKKIELTTNQLFVLRYILHQVAGNENCKGMKKYIVVREFIQPNKIPRIMGQFETRDKAEAFALGHEGKGWVYEMSM